MIKYDKKLLTTTPTSGNMIFGGGDTEKDIKLINKDYKEKQLNE